MDKVEIKMGNADVNGTCLQGYLHSITIQELVDIFGEPNSEGDGYKTDVEWEGTVNGEVFTIYNWKNGPNYYGNEDMGLGHISTWNVGGRNKEVVTLLTQYIKEMKRTLR